MTTREELSPEEAEYRRELADRAEAGFKGVVSKLPSLRNVTEHPNGFRIEMWHGTSRTKEGREFTTRDINAVTQTPEQKAAGGSVSRPLACMKSASFGEAELEPSRGFEQPREQAILDEYNRLAREDPEALRALELRELQRQLDGLKKALSSNDPKEKNYATWVQKGLLEIRQRLTAGQK